MISIQQHEVRYAPWQGLRDCPHCHGDGFMWAMTTSDDADKEICYCRMDLPIITLTNWILFSEPVTKVILESELDTTIPPF